MDFFGILFDMKNGKKIPYSKNYFDTLFAENLAGVTTLTGTLPLTFTTSETALRSWTIYGNNTPHIATSTGVLPLTFTTTEDKLRDWEIRGNDDVYEGQQGVGERTGNEFDKNAQDTDNGFISGAFINQDGSITLNNNYIVSEYIPIKESRPYFITFFTNNIPHAPAFVLYDENKEIIHGEIYNSRKAILISENYTLHARYIRLSVATAGTFQADSSTTLTEGSTAPSTYIPYGYQIPISEQGKNLFDKTAKDPEKGYAVNCVLNHTNGGVYTGYNGWYVSEYIPVTQGKYLVSNAIGNYPSICWYNQDKNFISGFNIGTSSFTSKEFDLPANVAYIRLSVSLALNEDILTLRKTTNYTFYIGSSPLTAGQSISKTSTGIDIELFEGENTVSTTLYNKPETSITYTDYLGVGEYVNGQWQIPLTVSDGTNTTTVNIPIDAPLTEGQSVTDTQTINTFEGENTIDTMLTNKPQMTITYKGG